MLSVRIKTTIKDRGYTKALLGVQSLDGLEVESGLPESGTAIGAYAMSELIKISAYHEFGSSTEPKRSFIRRAWDNNKRPIRHMSRDVVNDAMFGRERAANSVTRLAKMLVRVIKKRLSSGKFVPNAASTIRKKGFNTPLLEHGGLYNSIQSKVTYKA